MILGLGWAGLGVFSACHRQRKNNAMIEIVYSVLSLFTSSFR